MEEARELDPRLAERARELGIGETYKAFNGEPRRVKDETRLALLDAMGAADHDEPAREDVLVVTPESEYDLGNWRLVLESGEEISGTGLLPKPLIPGYHELFREDGTTALVISTPGSCLPVPQRQWGWALQLYALRSQRSWGMGDFDDLRRFAALARNEGAGVLMINPMHAPTFGGKQEASPYFPSSREFRSPLYLAVDRIEGSQELAESFYERGKKLNETELIDRDSIWLLKCEALEGIWENRREAIKSDPEFQRYLEEAGEPLRLFATYCALSEQHGDDWTLWPESLRHPASGAVRSAIDAMSDRISFHEWLQWMCSEQLRAAGKEIGLVTDLAVGASPTGADAWIWQDATMTGVQVGAPPDEFNTLGQNWSLPALNPWKLRAIRFAPFIRMLRAGFQHGAGLRIDHVMGLFRLYCIPASNSARDGAYVEYPWIEMMAIVALESHRSNAFVIGEDLGTVERYMRDALQSAGILSYKVLWFESDKPKDYPAASMATITTHDLPTVMGLLTKQDLQRQRDLGMEPDEGANQAIIDKVANWSGINADDRLEARDAVKSLTEILAKASSLVRVMTVEDGLGLLDRPNYPGTSAASWPNWSVPLPIELEDLEAHPMFLEMGQTMALGG